jgi:tRNA nucleotidyltransferase (CCA-adding enzyme)
MERINQPMETSLVGGAVRDSLLDLPVTERDWVVVGSTPAEMKDAGYVQVGKDFPVFLHPRSKEEYALARTERKVRAGHQGFECDASQQITLEEDLGRRDLTINAIAQDEQGKLIDPYNGLEDLKSRILRHVSDAFSEDPLRILRVARFAARFSHLGFRIADETRKLCEVMVARGDLKELSAERIFQEMDKALGTDHPGVFFNFLNEISASNQIWPELDSRLLELLDNSTAETNNAQGYALLFVDTPVDKINNRSQLLKTPRHYRELAASCSGHLESFLGVQALDSEQIVERLYQLDAIRRPARFTEYCDTCHLVAILRGLESGQKETWLNCYSIISNISSANVDAGVTGSAMGKAIKKLQIEAVESSHAN